GRETADHEQGEHVTAPGKSRAAEPSTRPRAAVATAIRLRTRAAARRFARHGLHSSAAERASPRPAFDLTVERGPRTVTPPSRSSDAEPSMAWGVSRREKTPRSPRAACARRLRMRSRESPRILAIARTSERAGFLARASVA